MQRNVSVVLRAIAARILLLPARGSASVKTVSCSNRGQGTVTGPADQPFTGLWTVINGMIPAAGPRMNGAAGQRPVTHGGGVRA